MGRDLATLQHQVRRFDVAVDDAHLVGVVEGFGGLDAELGDGAEEVAGVVGARGLKGRRLTEVSANGEWVGGYRLSAVSVRRDSRSSRCFVSRLRQAQPRAKSPQRLHWAITSARVWPST